MRSKDLEICPMTAERFLQRNNINILFIFIYILFLYLILCLKKKKEINKIPCLNEYISGFLAFKLLSCFEKMIIIMTMINYGYDLTNKNERV